MAHALSTALFLLRSIAWHHPRVHCRPRNNSARFWPAPRAWRAIHPTGPVWGDMSPSRAVPRLLRNLTPKPSRAASLLGTRLLTAALNTVQPLLPVSLFAISPGFRDAATCAVTCAVTCAMTCPATCPADAGSAGLAGDSSRDSSRDFSRDARFPVIFPELFPELGRNPDAAV
jgi:hypothetical protein